MKGLKFFSYLLFILIISTRCTDVVQVKLDEGSELMVIDAFLESRFDVQVIRIHKNSTYFNSQEPEPIVNAHIKLYDLTADTAYDFFYVREDRYELVAGKNAFIPYHQYKMEVTVDGYTYTALTTEPRGAIIDSISAKPFTKNQLTGEATPLYYMCYLWAKDKADNNPDYYWIKSSSDPASAITLCIDGTEGIVKNAQQDSIYFMPPYNLLGLQTFLPGTIVNVQIDAISQGTYDFLLQAQAQISNGGLFATTPENVKTNFISPSGAPRKAVGWFSMATSARVSRIIPH